MTLRAPQAILASAAFLVAMLLAAPAFAAEPAAVPSFALTSLATPTHFKPDGSEEPNYEVRFTNVGAKETNGSPIVLADTLPKGVTAQKVELELRYQLFKPKDFGEDPAVCQKQTVAEVTTVTCTIPPELIGSGEESSVFFPGEEFRLVIFVGLPGSAAEGDVLRNQATIEGGGAPAAAVSSENEVSTTPAPGGFAEFNVSLTGPDGKPVTQAASHPYQMTTSFSFNTKRNSPVAEVDEGKYGPSGGDPKDTPVILPPGMVGSATAAAQCSLQKFNTVDLEIPFPQEKAIQLQRNACPAGSVVGYITLRRVLSAFTNLIPIYNLVPPPGMPAQLGFNILNLPIFIDTEARPSQNYKIVGVVHNITEAKRLEAASITLWGNPADPRHDALRGNCLNPGLVDYPITIPTNSCPAGIEERPFLRLPTSCGAPMAFTMGLDTWTTPGNFAFATSTSPAPSGCGAVDFEPSLEARPTTNTADSPSGLHVDVHLPQSQDPKGLGEADMRKSVVTLPKGLTVNPSGANGLEGCSPEQIGVQESSPSGFDDQPENCPDGSRIGTVEADTPLLKDPLRGGVFVASPFDNPFNSLLAIYITAEDPERGLVAKLAGRVEADPISGQLKTTVDEIPQFPLGDVKLDLFNGPLAPLRTPPVCGAHSTTSELTPWSAPESGPPAVPSDTFTISQGANGGSCPESEGARPNSPSFEAGTVAPIARAYSPFILRLRRSDGSQELSSLSLVPPPGLLGKLAGIAICPDSALAVAAAKPGKVEKASPSCPSASRVGSAEVGAGAGPSPYFAQGTVYLAGPYKGGPLSMAVITPATAGPYDLGTVVSRVAVHIDPETTQITAASDPLPSILDGIPLDVTSIVVKLDRPGFTLNPTNCDPLAVTGTWVSTLGQTAALQNRFQVGDCAALPFKPRLNLRLKGGTKRASNPKFIATLSAKEGEANISRVSLTLPRSAFLDQSHIRTVCTRVQFAADACPPGSIYGRAEATTPLLDYPVSGNLYLRSSNHKLPDVVIDLRGPAYQPVRVDLVGRTDSVKGALRNTFDFVPDAPVSKFRVELFGGKRGLVINSRNLCAHKYRAIVALDSQSGKTLDTRPPVRNDCKGKPRHKRHTAR